MNGCQWDGDCDNCPANDCVASWRQAFEFYAREEAENKKRYGRASVRKEIRRQQSFEWWLQEGGAKWI